MSDPEKTPEKDPEPKAPENDPKPPAEDPKEPGDGEDGEDKGGGTIPEWKFKKQYKATKEAEDRAAEAERLLAERDEADKVAQGKHQELSEQYKGERDKAVTELGTLKEVNQKNEETFKAMLEKELEAIPEDRRSLIPTGYSAQAQLEYIAGNRTVLTGSDGKKGGTPGQPGNQNDPPADKQASAQKEFDDLMERKRTGDRFSPIDTARMRTLSRELAVMKKEKE